MTFSQRLITAVCAVALTSAALFSSTAQAGGPIVAPNFGHGHSHHHGHNFRNGHNFHNGHQFRRPTPGSPIDAHGRYQGLIKKIPATLAHQQRFGQFHDAGFASPGHYPSFGRVPSGYWVLFRGYWFVYSHRVR
jgi:hypothetical protein